MIKNYATVIYMLYDLFAFDGNDCSVMKEGTASTLSCKLNK